MKTTPTDGFNEAETLALANRMENAAANARTAAEGEDLRRRARAARLRVAERREAEERVHLLDDLLYQNRNRRALPWSDAELNAMTLNRLREAHQIAFPRGDAKAPTGDFAWARRSIIAGTDSVIAQKD